jgi:hypothetical protein
MFTRAYTHCGDVEPCHVIQYLLRWSSATPFAGLSIWKYYFLDKLSHCSLEPVMVLQVPLRLVWVGIAN